MSAYTLGEIVVWLLLAATVGFGLGWLARTLRYASAGREVAASGAALWVPGTPADEAPRASAPKAGAYPDSAAPLAGGGSPSAAYVIKGKSTSMIFHPPGSPAYERTVADVWFKTESAASAAGFRKPRNA